MTALPVIAIGGDARERGRQHGEAARDRVARSLAYYREVYLVANGVSWTQAVEAARARVSAIEAYAPGLLDEVRGIAEGAGHPFDDILWLNGRMTARGPVDPPQEGCTSFALLGAASADGHTYCGQNWDWREAVLDTIVFLRIAQPPKPTILMQVEAGQIARQGASSAGIALNANALPGPAAGRAGIPGPYVRRRVLDSWTLEDATAAVRAAARSGSTNLLLAHRDRACDLETTTDHVEELAPTDGVLVHGNHFAGFVPQDGEIVDRPWADSLYRVPRTTLALAAAKTAERPRETIALALRDHFGRPRSVCRHPDESAPPSLRSQTLVSSIVNLTSGEYWVTLGMPCESAYEPLPWNLYEGTS